MFCLQRFNLFQTVAVAILTFLLCFCCCIQLDAKTFNKSVLMRQLILQQPFSCCQIPVEHIEIAQHVHPTSIAAFHRKCSDYNIHVLLCHMAAKHIIRMSVRLSICHTRNSQLSGSGY